VRKIGADMLCQAEPSVKILNVWSLELSDSDSDLQFHALHSFYNAAKKFGYKHTALPIAPGWDHFKETPDYFMNIWRAWWAENREAMLSKAQKADADQSPPQPDFKAPQN
jgi:hypothetical protein